MPISLPSPRSVALLGLLLVGLAMLADGAVHVELARAVHASLNDGVRNDGVRTVAGVAASDE